MRCRRLKFIPRIHRFVRRCSCGVCWCTRLCWSSLRGGAFQIPHDGGGGHQVDEILLEAVAENSVVLGEEDQHFCNYSLSKKAAAWCRGFVKRLSVRERGIMRRGKDTCKLNVDYLIFNDVICNPLPVGTIIKYISALRFG